MDEQRALLDQLMGTSRDLSESQRTRLHRTRFSDQDVCKHYLCGLCPYVAFAATKSDMGKCPKRICNSIDADNCRAEWEALSQKEKDRYGYERDLLRSLENIVKACDRKIEKQKQRTDQDLLLSAEDIQRVYVLHKQTSDCLKECDNAVEEENYDRVYEILKQVTQLQDAANKITNPPDEKRNIVCEISGNYMSSRDNDERMRAHFEGKQYLGWKLVREKYHSLLSALKSPRSYNRSSPVRSSKTSSRREENSGRHRSRSRDKDRYRDSDRESRKGRETRNRSEERHRHRHRRDGKRRRSREREHSRSRERDRSR